MLTRRNSVAIIIILLALTGCGRKEPPVPMAETAPPRIVSIKHDIHLNVLEVDMLLDSGDPNGVGYQIDRAPIDPYCNCVGFWRRYRSEQPRASWLGAKVKVMLNLGGGTYTYAFRIRAVDALGRLGSWSKVIRARSQLKASE